MALLEEALGQVDTAELWLSLAAAQLKADNHASALMALGQMLSRHVLLADPTTVTKLVRLACVNTAIPGWCAATRENADAKLTWAASRNGAKASLDGVKLSGPLLPPSGTLLEITHHGIHLLGSPIDLRALRRVEGLVEATNDGLFGWAWHPADANATPWLTITSANKRTLRVRATDDTMEALRPLSRPRRFNVTLAELARLEPPLRVTGPDGIALTGSPIYPSPLRPTPIAPNHPPAHSPLAPQRPVALVIPAYRNLALTSQCLESAFATTKPDTPIIVIDDATPETALAAWLEKIAATGRVTLIRHPTNLGFPTSANAGLQAAFALSPPHDVLLLNSDTILPRGRSPSWLGRLQARVHAAPDIGTASPLSNDASILSFPARDGTNPIPDAPTARQMDEDARRSNAGLSVDIPTGVGFCLYIRHECAADTGLFRTDAFAQGYGEENDFCLRASQLGWRHVAVPGVFVGHASHTSFGTARLPLMQRNLTVLEHLHPGYRDLISAYQAVIPAQDALAASRRRMDCLRWARTRRKSAVLLVSHDSGGGVEKLLRTRIQAIITTGQRAIVLRPVRDPRQEGETLPGLCRVSDATNHAAFPNLIFDLRHEIKNLAALLRPDRPNLFEVHHRLGHHPRVMTLATALKIPVEFRLHDYAAFCPRVTLFGAGQTYCGEPTQIADCEICVATAGNRTGETIGVAALRSRSANEFTTATRVVVPSFDMARRLRRYFPALQCTIIPNEVDTPAPPPRPRPSASRRIAVIGGITVEKGYKILLACARDAAEHQLPLEFVLIGHSENDALLFETGRVFVTGPYAETEAEALIKAQSADLAFLPSIVPESWGFTLGLAWRAGLRAVVFDLGAMASRVKATGYGTVLPLGLPPGDINRQLLHANGVTPS